MFTPRNMVVNCAFRKCLFIGMLNIVGNQYVIAAMMENTAPIERT